MRGDGTWFMDIVHLTQSITTKRYLNAGIVPGNSVLLHCLTSGLDVGLTVLQSYDSEIAGLTVEAASNVVNYFRKEAERYISEQEIKLWYLSWADAVEEIYLKD